MKTSSPEICSPTAIVLRVPPGVVRVRWNRGDDHATSGESGVGFRTGRARADPVQRAWPACRDTSDGETARSVGRSDRRSSAVSLWPAVDELRVSGRPWRIRIARVGHQPQRERDRPNSDQCAVGISNRREDCDSLACATCVVMRTDVDSMRRVARNDRADRRIVRSGNPRNIGRRQPRRAFPSAGDEGRDRNGLPVVGGWNGGADSRAISTGEGC